MTAVRAASPSAGATPGAAQVCGLASDHCWKSFQLRPTHSSATVARSTGVESAWPLRSGSGDHDHPRVDVGALQLRELGLFELRAGRAVAVGDHVELRPGQVRRDPARLVERLGDLGLVLGRPCAAASASRGPTSGTPPRRPPPGCRPAPVQAGIRACRRLLSPERGREDLPSPVPGQANVVDVSPPGASLPTCRPRGARPWCARSWFGPNAGATGMIVPAEGDFRLDHEADTERLGAAIARELKAREAVCLWGPLGAGKSTLARGADPGADRRGRRGAQPHLHPGADLRGAGALPLAHFDLYRLDRPEEVAGARPRRGAGRGRGGDRVAREARPPPAARPTRRRRCSIEGERPPGPPQRRTAPGRGARLSSEREAAG